MDVKTQRKLARLFTAAATVVAGGVIGLLLVPADNRAMQKTAKSEKPVRQIKVGEPTIKLDDKLLKIKLQSPLDPPKPPEMKAAKPSPPRRNWPSIALENIIGDDSTRVAVFKNGNQLITCSPGDKFLNVVVEKISASQVELKLDGVLRTFQISRSRK